MVTMGDIIAEHRRSYPGKLALADGERRLTWPELDERVGFDPVLDQRFVRLDHQPTLQGVPADPTPSCR